jgi:hypothetical protein
LTGYSADRIRDALPIVPFTLCNERTQRFENLYFAVVNASQRHHGFLKTGRCRCALGSPMATVEGSRCESKEYAKNKQTHID